MVAAAGALDLPWLDEPLLQASRLRGHALLVQSAGGCGEFELALLLAQQWLCEDTERAPQHRPCERCAACHLMRGHAHPDFMLLLPEALRERLGWSGEGDDGEAAEGRAAKAKPSRELRVEAVRAAIDWSQRTSSRGRAKVVVIHPADAMNAVSANALLKTLEEPPGQLRLVLTTADPERLLPTVRSRCQRLPLALPPRAQSLAWLRERGLAEGEAEVLWLASGARPQEALALAADGVSAAVWQAVPAAARRGDASAVTAWPLPRLVETLRKLCHDLMVRAAGGAPRYFPAACLPTAPASMPALSAWSRELAQAARQADHPWNAGLYAQALMLQAARVWSQSAPSSFDTLHAR